MPTFEAPSPAEGEGPCHQILQDLDIGLVRANLEGYILELTPRFATLLGLPPDGRPDATVGLHLADITPPQDLAATLTQMEAALAGERQPWVVGPHEGFADEEGVHVGRTHPCDVRGCQDPALSDDDPIAGYPWQQG